MRSAAPTLAQAPSTPLALTPELAEAVRRLETGGVRYFDGPVTIEPLGVESRPFSLVLRVRVSGRNARGGAFVKAYTLKNASDEHRRFIEERIGRDYAVSEQVHTLMRATPGLGAVRPIAWFPDLLVLVTDEVPGRTLAAVVSRRARWWPREDALGDLESILERVGQWIATYQRLQTPHASAGVFSLDAMREYLEVRLNRLTSDPRFGFTRAESLRVLAYFDAVAERVARPELETVPIHADLAPANILIEAGQVTVIDFAMAAHGGRLHDISRLHAQLDLFAAKPTFLRQVIDRLQNALLSGFEAGLTADRPLFALFTLQHVVCHLISLAEIRESFPASAYSRYLHARHRRWLRATTRLQPASIGR